MDIEPEYPLEDRLVFAEEVTESENTTFPGDDAERWKILIVDDEEDVHKITRITLRGYLFEGKRLEFLSAYCGADVKSILKKETNIALILLDVVMEKDDTGLVLVEYIRNQLKNSVTRIVLRTGQPGKAPEQEVITKYDINDYKTKPELTAQKLFTTVTACLRAYSNLKIIKKNNDGLKAIIRSTAKVFQNPSFSNFGPQVLIQLLEILNIDVEEDLDSAYLIGMPNSTVLMAAGSGCFKDNVGQTLDEAMPPIVIETFNKYVKTGGEVFSGAEYIGIFKTREGFYSILYIEGYDNLSDTGKKFVRIYANNIAIGFDNLSLSREIINTQKEVILTLGEIVETRSQETANHVTRVAEHCHILAEKYGMDETTCEMLRLASPMHDVGKIGVPEAILNKPAKLTDAEFEIVKKHAQIGYEILKKSNRSIMQTAAIVALQHHEKWDGTGYPQGLSGENIHIFGRIAAIADVFDALSHKRCYKEPWPMDEILEYFKLESGNHFDKRLLDIFFENINDFEAINKRFPG